MHSTDIAASCTRRELLRIAGGSLAVASSTLYAPHPALAAPDDSGFCLRADSLSGSAGLDIAIIAQAARFSDLALEDALANVSVTVLQQRIDQGARIFDVAQAQLVELGYHIRFQGETLDLNTPPLFSNEVFQIAEANLLILGAGDKILAAVLAGLGLKEFVEPIKEVLDEAPGAPSLSFMLELLLAKNWTALRPLIGQLLRYLVSRDFLTRLGKKIGGKAAKGVLKQIAGRFLPFIGWVILIGTVIYTLVKDP